ncbi:hypothetical protein TNCV_1269431 [Trichonephila clavipes]|nr:hypothetical protein TNCV_1269431 [Trichonephila clavipes]
MTCIQKIISSIPDRNLHLGLRRSWNGPSKPPNIRQNESGLGYAISNQITTDVVHEQMFRSGGQSDAKIPSVKFPSTLVTHFINPLEGLRAESILPNPRFEARTCGVEAQNINHSATGLPLKVLLLPIPVPFIYSF